jgi:hypothetical protein
LPKGGGVFCCCGLLWHICIADSDLFCSTLFKFTAFLTNFILFLIQKWQIKSWQWEREEHMLLVVGEVAVQCTMSMLNWTILLLNFFADA